MQVRIPFLTTHLPELTPLPQARRQEILARCADDPTMRSIARRHVMLMRAGWAILPVGLIASLLLWRARAGPRVMIGVLNKPNE